MPAQLCRYIGLTTLGEPNVTRCPADAGLTPVLCIGWFPEAGGRMLRTDARDAVAVTALDGLEHLVPGYALAERWRDDGCYPAWCGTSIFSASMCEPPGKPCPLCSCAAALTRGTAV